MIEYWLACAVIYGAFFLGLFFWVRWQVRGMRAETDRAIERLDVKARERARRLEQLDRETQGHSEAYRRHMVELDRREQEWRAESEKWRAEYKAQLRAAGIDPPAIPDDFEDDAADAPPPTPAAR